MNLTAPSEVLWRLTQVLEKLRIDYMLVGAHALPLYGRPRSTIDIDIAIALRSSDSTQLGRELLVAGFQVSSLGPETPCFVVTDTKAKIEVEVWIHPTGIILDEECLRRRRKIKMDAFDFWIIGPEDFIVNKLARIDRRAIDEADVLSVMKNDRLKLDTAYLHTVAERADILPLMRAVEKKAGKQ